jgi:hypothetical protein
MKIIRTIFALLALAALAVHAQETGGDGTVGTGTGGRAAGNGADGTDDPSLPPVPSPPLTGCGMAAIKRCRAAQEVSDVYSVVRTHIVKHTNNLATSNCM